MINADVRPGGVLRVALLDAEGRPIPGYEIERSAELTGDETRWRVRWSEQAGAPTDRLFRIRIELKNARLYSLGF